MILQDICTELDLLALDVQAATDFGSTPLEDKIRVAIEDWVEPRLIQHGYLPELHRTRRPADAVFGYTGGAWSDLTADAKGEGSDINLATVLATPSTDALYIGLARPFRGLFLSLGDTVNSREVAASLTYWNGSWNALPSSLTDGTVVSGVPFARAGRIYWPTPADWIRREINDNGPRWWVRVQVNSIPTSCPIAEVLPITRSRLTHPAALEALSKLYFEGIGSSRGDWAKKAEDAHKLAETAFDLVVNQIVDEFDVNDDGKTEATEANSLTDFREPWTWERG